MERAIKRKRIAFLRFAALGDILQTTPLIREVRKKNPNAEIIYITDKFFFDVLKDNIYVDRILTLESKALFNKNIIAFIKTVFILRRERIDEIYVLGIHYIYAFLAFISGIKVRCGLKRDFLSLVFLNKFFLYKHDMHQIDNFLQLVPHKVQDKSLYFNLQEKDKLFARELMKENSFKDYVVVVNSGGKNIKESGGIRMLPKDKFKQLISLLKKKYKIVFLGSKSEKEYYEEFVDKNITNCCGLDLGQSIGIMYYAKRIFTTDNGCLHMAATVNENITAIFGPTSPQRSAPFVKGLKLIWEDEEKYTIDYQSYGKNPQDKYFTTIDFRKYDL